MKRLYAVVLACLLSALAFAQDIENEEEEKKGFKKENLFTGGSLSLSFFNNQFLVGGNPVLGYSLTRWIDAGIVVNYTYASQRDYSFTIEKLRQSVYGGGAFVRIFPVKFLFVQGQFEHNFIRQKAFYSGGFTEKFKAEANSFLVGGGYTSGREPFGGFFYLAILVDVMNELYSPYIDNDVNGNRSKIPIIRAGIQIPLFSRESGVGSR